MVEVGSRGRSGAGEPGSVKTRASTSRIQGLSAICLLLALVACGKEGPPLPPEIRIAERTTDLTAYQEGQSAVLRWTYPSMTTAGQSLSDVEAIEVWRAALPLGQEPPPPVTPQDRVLQRQLLESQGEVIRKLDPAEITAATRGSDLVYRDNLMLWRQGLDGDPESLVVWYGVRTICCRKRESDLSNVARLLPAQPPEPPEGLLLTAGAEGIDVRWKEVPGTQVLIERSADGTVWKQVVEEPVKGGEWKDEEAAQGREWSFRLRSVVRVEGGGMVVGEASAAARVDHPDTYPPSTPTDVVCLPEGAQVRVRWQLVPGAATYELTRRSGGAPPEVLASDLRSVEFTDVKPPLGEISYAVVARDAVGNASGSAECSVVMGAVP